MELQTIPASRGPARSTPGTDRLWECFVRTRDPQVREQLIKAYAGFARMMAAKVYANRVFTEMEFEEYLQYATVGLIEAVDRFEPERGFKFETYAARRITGAMLTGIESSSEIQEQIAARRRVVADRLALLNDDGKVAGKPGDVFSRLAELAIGLAVGFALEDSGMHRAGDCDYPDNSYHGVELKQMREKMLVAVAQLSPNQRQVIQSHYLQHIAFEEIATTLRLSRGRVAQIHKEALANLRTRLQKRGGVDLSC